LIDLHTRIYETIKIKDDIFILSDDNFAQYLNWSEYIFKEDRNNILKYKFATNYIIELILNKKSLREERNANWRNY